MGISDRQFHCRTHLGNIISPGDTILGYLLDRCFLSDLSYISNIRTTLPHFLVLISTEVMLTMMIFISFPQEKYLMW